MAALNKNNSGKYSVSAAVPTFRLTVLALAVKRIMQEARELANDPCTDYSAAPLEVTETTPDTYVITLANTPA